MGAQRGRCEIGARPRGREKRPLLATVLVATLGAASCDDLVVVDVTGVLEVVVTTTGGAVDPDGYRLRVGSSLVRNVAVEDTVTIGGLAAGPYFVELTGVASNCSVTGSARQAVEVVAGRTVGLTLEVVCVATRDEAAFAGRRAERHRGRRARARSQRLVPTPGAYRDATRCARNT